MKIVKVTYSTNAAYAATNQENIKKVMNDLQGKQQTGIFYHVCLGDDGKSFTHTAFFKSAEDQKILNELPSFKYFQEQLTISSPEIPPKQEWLTLVGSSTHIF